MLTGKCITFSARAVSHLFAIRLNRLWCGLNQHSGNAANAKMQNILITWKFIKSRQSSPWAVKLVRFLLNAKYHRIESDVMESKQFLFNFEFSCFHNFTVGTWWKKRGKTSTNLQICNAFCGTNWVETINGKSSLLLFAISPVLFYAFEFSAWPTPERWNFTICFLVLHVNIIGPFFSLSFSLLFQQLFNQHFQVFNVFSWNNIINNQILYVVHHTSQIAHHFD